MDEQRPVTDADRVMVPGGLVGPQDRTPIATEMPLSEFHHRGLLWWVNKTLLWDLGLALAIEYEPLAPGEGENSRRVKRLFVREYTPPQRIVDREDDAARFEAFMRWLAARAGTVR
jgi:hypothetical protein